MTTASLVLPAKNEAKRLFSNLQDLEAFLRKFPLQVEVLIVMDPSHDATEAEFQKFQTHLSEAKNSQLNLRLLKNEKQQGRSASVARGLQAAAGDVILVSSLGWSVPLTEVFQALQEILLTPKVDLVIGNRHTSRKKRTATRSSWYWTLENLIQEKLQKENLKVQDPLSPFLAFKKASLEKILPAWQAKGWYYTPGLLKLAREKEFSIKEIPILSNDRQPTSMPLLREYLRNLF